MLFWDACAIIYFVEGVDPWAESLIALLDTLDREHSGHAVSELSVLECRVKPLSEQNASLLALYEQFFTRKDLTHVSMSREVVLEAARIRALYNLRTPDALQSASALSLPADVLLLTNDACFSRVPGLKTRIVE